MFPDTYLVDGTIRLGCGFGSVLHVSYLRGREQLRTHQVLPIDSIKSLSCRFLSKESLVRNMLTPIFLKLVAQGEKKKKKTAKGVES